MKAVIFLIAKNFPLGDIGSSPISILPDKSQMILVYCRSGKLSRQASEKLVKLDTLLWWK